jgi:ubiquinone biosynthesis protein
VKRGLKQAFGLKRILERLPSQTTRVLDKLEKGRIKIEMKDTDIERLSVELDKSSNRLTYGMIMAALLISGSLTINIGDKFAFGLPLISFLCFSAAGILGIVLIVSILRERSN